MRKKLPVYVVDIIGEVATSMASDISPMVLNYTYGRNVQILEQLQRLEDSITLKNTKFPLLALFQDFPEVRGTGYYAEVTIPKIIIACLTRSTDPPKVRYEQTFKPILYPIYYSFLDWLVKHKNVVVNEPDELKHVKWDRPGTIEDGGNLREYYDAIEIQNLKLLIIQTKTC